MASKNRIYKVEVQLKRRPSVFRDAGKVGGPDDFAKLIGRLDPACRNASTERIGLLALDAHHSVVAWALIGKGMVGACQVEPRLVLQVCLLSNASAAVLYHNHPSGESGFSEDDIAITKRTAKSMRELLGVNLLDHILLAGDDHRSMREEMGGVSA